VQSPLEPGWVPAAFGCPGLGQQGDVVATWRCSGQRGGSGYPAASCML